MSWRRLPRACGTVVTCDGEGCGVESVTGQVVAALHRQWLRSKGWGRGSLRPTKHGPGTTGDDLCPSCLERDRAAARLRMKAPVQRRERLVTLPV